MSEYYLDQNIAIAPDNNFGYIFKVNLYQLGTGNLVKSRQTLESVPGGTDDKMWLGKWLRQALFERDYRAAMGWVNTMADVGEDELTVAFHRASVFVAQGDLDAARVSLEEFRTVVEDMIVKNPNRTNVISLLGLAYAYLGRKDEAIRHGKRATELKPIVDHPVLGLRYVRNLAGIYAYVGEFDAALEQLDYLLSVPSFTTVERLRLEYVWDPIRDHPGFQAIVGQTC